MSKESSPAYTKAVQYVQAEHESELHDASATVEKGHSKSEGSSMADSVNTNLTVLVWITFFITLAIVTKFGLKPILAGLKAREDRIRESMDEADKAREQLEEIETTRGATIAAANDEAKEIIEKAKVAADEAALTIRNKANEDAKIMIENSQRDIGEAQNVARATLRKESADIAVQIASKIVGENLDNEKSRALTDRLINEI
ncbi:MAG: F0F1 ATP synthase subunit B [Lentisphaeria bacterium]|nr:F0F1 ATP synthase subunit B [Lentisphaeria bacterium]NQZ66634.1 F0F1 ATP synthase subunit B [Lentisphaeria bacterium]